jgi:3-methyladenine DNA glycosylase AlkD
MTAKEILAEMKKAGSEQTRKTYRRHGVTGDVIGVSYAFLGALKKKIKTDHALALDLWNTGIHDAQVFATMIADPAKFDAKTADAWLKDVKDHVLAGAFAGIVAASSLAQKKAAQWTAVDGELTGCTGWTVVARMAMSENDLGDKPFEDYLATIEKTIHHRENFCRYAMNNALIAIGIRNPKLQKKAIAAARKIGKVEVDHGDTACKTPDAEPYILKAVKRKRC